MPKISVIMPVYNVEKYLRECLDSVLAQTMRDFEVICVDDSSTDGSAAILEEYARKDSRVRVFRRPHSNAGAVRNFGMSVAKGEYYIFLDSDDYFSPWMFETLLDGARKYEADVAACTSQWFRDGSCPMKFEKPADVHWKPVLFGGMSSENPFVVIASMPWNKIIRRQFMEENHLRFLEQPTTNDVTCMYLSIALAKKMVRIDEPLIAYRRHANSIQAKKSKNPESYLNAIRAYCDGLRERGVWGRQDVFVQRAFLAAFVRNAIYHLDTQVTRRGYYAVHNGMEKFDCEMRFLKTFVEHGGALDGCTKRYAEIVNVGKKERLRMLVESSFAWLRGNRGRISGAKLDLLRFVDLWIWRLFESKKLPWNRTLDKGRV